MSDLKKLFKGEHPFITDPGLWIVAGHGLSGDPLNRIPIQGRMQVKHSDGKIENTGEMSVVSRTNPVTFQTLYEMVPTDDELVLDFFQSNQSVGDLKGKVVVVDDRIVSSYASGDGRFAGCEVLMRMGDNRYAATGTLQEGGQLVNLWKLDLVRPVEGGGQE